ncbi:PKD domain-containing protein [Zobellia sp. 1_MG-2023]|uniref:PKD domain-containing protein n=1 Tax=Zobellia sp. 1_MG-2023 TaxID=3062626 RepID=UPI0026E338EB|nr:PKD domain-containing protein [Zobellia sp. 1_MG-2023]MDO6820657.1 PKD domain-containing protein [Zobellia sp. 1_MG-2023]
MNISPKRTFAYISFCAGLTFLLNLACSKDVETLREAVISKDISPVVDQETPSGSQQDSLEVEVEEPQVKDSVIVETEIRTFVFYPINDAYLQNGKGYNEPIVRLEEERRTSYLMFDFSPIDSIGGTINAATLMFTINTDDGNGEVDVYRGESSNWSETDLSEKSAPETGGLLGVAKQEYRIGTEVSIDLEVGELQLEPVTFILDHKDGDDLAFASKEHESQAGSSLVVEYEVPIGADDIALFVTSPKEVDDETQNPNNIEEDNTTVEEAPKEVPAEEEEDSSEQNEPTTEEEEEVDVDEETPQEVPTDASENEPDQDTTTDNKGEDNTDSNIDALPNTPFPKNEPPVAIANASPVNGQAPLKVSFSGIDSSDDKAIVSYKWNFEDGQTGNTAEIEHTFDKAGSYEVTLVTKDEEGISASDVIMITVEESKGNTAPVAKLSASKTSGTLPLAVKFTGSGSTDDTGVTAYSWDFKDGNSSDKSDPSHTFESAGSYEVELTVTDAGGLKNKETVSITVESKENGAPVAKPSASKTSGTLPLTVNFTGSGSTDDTGVTAYSWDFKDGNSSDKPDPSHTFDSAGSYEVELTVTDAEGLKNKETVSITVESKENGAPVAKLSASKTSGTLPLTVNFTGSGSTDDTGVTAYSWDFKDGNSSDKPDPSHTFESAGSYEVELTVTDEEGLKNKETVSIIVESKENGAPVAKLSASKTSGTLPLTVNFTGSGSTDDTGVTAYSWDFKDGNSSDKSDPLHTFDSAGSYEVELTVTDAEGLKDTKTVSIRVDAPANQPPIAKVGASTQSGQAPLTINFTGSNSSDDIGVTAYMWDFKDGSTSNKSNPSHTFDSAGTYEVELTVADVDGLQNKETITVNVQAPVNNPPVAVAHANTLSGEAPLAVSFTGSDSSDDKGVTRYDWNISGNYSNEVNPSHVFTAPGFYDVSLTVTDEEGLTSITSLSVDVTQPKVEGPIDCSVGGKTAGETGEKVWCWQNIDIPSYSGRQGIPLANEELYIDSECNENQITKSGSRLRFRLDPTNNVSTGSWCRRDYNMRAEIRTAPWDIRLPKGTEEWFGWSYTFGNNYEIDKNNQWKFFQVHPGVTGLPPQIGLEITHENQFRDHEAGEIYVTNAGGSLNYTPTGVVPRAGQTIDVVVHAIWEDNSKGLLQVWIDGNLVYDKQVSTLIAGYPWGGNAKWGIYKWPWAKANAVAKSKQQGINSMETYMGSLRIVTRKPGDKDYKKDAYSLVAPN